MIQTYRQTFTAKPADLSPEWHIIDATDQILGRLASHIAICLRGKHKPTYTPHMDTGDYIVVINASKIKVTGKKMTDKKYYRHTGYPGGIKEMSFDTLLSKHPERVIELAVKRMLPKGPLGYRMLRKLKVYANTDHPHSAQSPAPLTFSRQAIASAASSTDKPNARGETS